MNSIAAAAAIEVPPAAGKQRTGRINPKQFILNIF